ncbi:DNase I-like protein [Apiospora hydei]|uniref:DNase I-like protein n=1 Tax=Apiospora hydei TaxID=1337664 RepID=A0ABR1XC23_9PEZI
MKGSSLLSWLITTLVAGVSALTIGEINGDRFLSSYNGQDVSNVTGIVTAKGPDGLWVQSVRKGDDRRVSDAIYIFGSALAKNASISTGDVIVLSGTVSEYRSSKDYLYMTEITSPMVAAILEHDKEVTPKVIGKDTYSPPTTQYTSLDEGDVFAVPNNKSLVSVVNPVLEPEEYGLDFWESLSGQLVTVKSPRAIGRPNNYGDTWVVGDWATSGENGRGGLTVTPTDSNPEGIIIGSPLDGSKNPTDTKLGDTLEDITGVVYQAFGFYRILPLIKITVLSSQEPVMPPATSLTSDGVCSGLTIGSYNIENFWPGDTAHVQAVAQHIVEYLKTPDLMFLQEVQDDNGATNDGTVSSDLTLSTLAAAIETASGGVGYNFTYVAPVNNKDGGAPSGNIRTAYLFRRDVLALRDPNPADSTTANEVLPGGALKYNPGLIDPTDAAFTNSRKPLAAAWHTLDGNNTFYTVNVHWGSKGGSSSIHGDARPPVNGGVEDRIAQAEVTADFIAAILAEDPEAHIISSGDFNEYPFVKPITDFESRSHMQDLDVVAGIDVLERYSYLYDMNTQELDHMFVSPTLAETDPLFEHIHVNTWVAYDDMVSDHDPSVAKMNLCKY